MMRVKIIVTLILLLSASAFCISCWDGTDVTGSEPSSVEKTDKIEIEIAERNRQGELDILKAEPLFPYAKRVLIDRGYKMYLEYVESFIGYDPSTGTSINLTIVPFIPADENHVAFIHMLRCGQETMITTAEYSKSQEDAVPISLDGEVYQLMVSEATNPECISYVSALDERNLNYWKCVGKVFGAGCTGCVVKCVLAGPGWGGCAASCCIGAAVVSLITCAFAVTGW